MFHKTTLKNGLRLILAPQAGTQAVTVLILLPVGSRYEQLKNNGVSHFIEHLMFKGTEKRPTSLDITKELDSIGAQYNAFTGKDHTGYYIKAPAEKIELLFDILSDMLFHSKFDSKEIEKERGVIVEEINMYEDNPLIHVESLLEESMYQDNPLARQISGPRSVIKEISRQEILKYQRTHYKPSRMVVTVAGKFSFATARKLTLKYFHETGGKAGASKFVHFHQSQARPRLNLLHKESQQVQLCMGFLGYSYFHPDLYPLYVVSIILGGNMSSRLFVNVREKHGLAYFIKASSSVFADTGALVIQAGLDKGRIDQAITLILHELKKIRDEGITDKELSDAKDFLRGKIILELEDSESVADWYGKQELFLKKMYTPQQRLKKIYKVNMRDISRATHAIIDEKKLSMALIGPYKNSQKERFLKLLKI